MFLFSAVSGLTVALSCFLLFLAIQISLSDISIPVAELVTVTVQVAVTSPSSLYAIIVVVPALTA